MSRAWLLTVTAVGEGATGLLLLVLPGAVLALLLGVNEAGQDTLFLGRIAGAALLAVGVTCWLARREPGGPAQRGVLAGVLIYNVSGAALLAYAGLALNMAGPVLWPAAVLHAALAVWCAGCLWGPPGWGEGGHPRPPPFSAGGATDRGVMMTDGQQPPAAAPPPETADALRRILAAVEDGQSKHWVETASAVVLALATAASAWCAYQATLWSGVQTFRLVAADRAEQLVGERTLTAHQHRAVDAAMLVKYLEAQGQGDRKLAEFLSGRFRPEFRKAADAWLRTDPINNSDAPRTPFEMGEYVLEAEQEADRGRREAAGLLAAAQQASGIADRYVLLTVLLATVLFFTGIGGTFRARRLRLVLFAVGLGLFLVTAVALAAMPICRE